MSYRQLLEPSTAHSANSELRWLSLIDANTLSFYSLSSLHSLCTSQLLFCQLLPPTELEPSTASWLGWESCYIAVVYRHASQKTESLLLRHKGYHVIATVVLRNRSCVVQPRYLRGNERCMYCYVLTAGAPRDHHPGSSRVRRSPSSNALSKAVTISRSILPCLLNETSGHKTSCPPKHMLH
jgi:hypothetical protein